MIELAASSACFALVDGDNDWCGISCWDWSVVNGTGVILGTLILDPVSRLEFSLTLICLIRFRFLLFRGLECQDSIWILECFLMTKIAQVWLAGPYSAKRSLTLVGQYRFVAPLQSFKLSTQRFHRQ